MAGNMTPTPGERRFLRGIAAINQNAKPGEEAWWSSYDLQHTTLHPDFRNTPTLSLAATGRSAVAKGMAVTRQDGTRSHRRNFWAEYRITSFGRGLVADSCIGGGGQWAITSTAENGAIRSISSACPACRATAAELGISPDPERVPAHALPGYAPSATTTREGSP